MADTSSNAEAEIICRFVKDGESPSAVCLEAYEVIKDIGARSEWFSTDECFSVVNKERRVLYVFESFGGPAFRHVESVGNRIFGPVCILHSIKQDKQLPNEEHPVFSRAMEGLVVSCTGLLKKDRERVHEKMSWMLAEVSKDFHDRVTHLVAAEVGSKKYIVAANLRKPIMAPDWIDAVWTASETSFMHAGDVQFDRFRCPVFKGHVITVSGIDTSERGRIKQHIEREGGRYSGEMKINECTHLIIQEPTGQKYEFARKWHIHIVSPQWLYDSLDRGYSQEEHRYKVEGKSKTSKSTSTPTSCRDISRLSNLGDISAITTSRIDETALSNASSVSLMPRFSLGGANVSIATNNKSVALASLTLLDNLEVVPPNKGDMFLDGSKIYLSGFTAAQMDKLRKIINIGGGTRFNQINSSVSHVVCGKLVPDDMDLIQQTGLRPHVVGVDWLMDCLKQGMCMPEESYYCVDMPDIPDNTSRRSSVDKPAKKTTSSAAEAGKTDHHDDMNDIMSQYMPGNNTGTLGESTLLRAAELESQQNANTTVVSVKKADVTVTGDVTQGGDDDMTQDITSSTVNEGRGLLFGKTFALIGFDSRESQEELTGFIEEAGGTMVPLTSRRIADYGIVPLFSNSVPVQMTVGEVATNAWLQISVQDNRLYAVSENDLFSPLDIDTEAEPLNGCVLSFSGISGTERDVLLHVAEEAGARCQDFFVKKATDQLAASTHLVCATADGTKYKAAKKWKLPAVTKKWIIACLKAGRKVDVNDYLVELVEETPAPVTASTPQAAVSTVQPPEPPTHQQEDTNTKPASSAAKTPSSAVQSASPAVKTSRQSLQPSTTPKPSSVTSLSPRTPGYDASSPCPSPAGEANARPGVERNADVGRNLEVEEMTPLQNARVKQLKRDNPDGTQQAGPSPKRWNNIPGVDSPSVFMDENKPFRPKLDFTGYRNLYPPTPTTPGGTKFKPKTKEEEASENFMKGLMMGIAHQNKAMAEGRRISINSQPVDDANDSLTGGQPGPLYGVIIAVSKKLSASQSELNNMAASLGADYRWTYDSECTHYIFKGRQNDLNKEFRMARNEGKVIVSPHWIMMCKEQNCRVDETLFPHTYNPNLSLGVKSTPTPARRRPTRSRLVKNNPPDNESNATSPSKPPVAMVTPGKASKRALEVEVVKDNGRTKKMKMAAAELDKTHSDEEMAARVNEAENKVKEETAVSLVNDLKNIMQATKTYSRSKRRNRAKELSDSVGSDGASAPRRRGSKDILGDDDNTPCRTSRRNNGSRKLNIAKPCTETLTEASQMCEVSWDDPESRQQRERLAAELAKSSESFSPPPAGVAVSSDDDVTHALGLPTYLAEDEVRKKETAAAETETDRQDRDRVPTPDNPSIAFPVTRASVRVSPPRPVELLADDDPDMTVGEIPPDVSNDKKENTQPVFLLSGMSTKERDTYGALIEELGGLLSESNYYDPKCTHLVIGAPTRNEKYLACVASGKWILHKSFLESSRQSRHFVEEVDHEWGGVGTERVYSSLQPNAVKLAMAARRWRTKLSPHHTLMNEACGAFSQWTVTLLTDSKKEDGFRRLLEAGSAAVIPAKQALSNPGSITHAFLDLGKINFQVDISSLVKAGVHCVKPEYIAAFLMEDPAPKPRVYHIPEAVACYKT